MTRTAGALLLVGTLGSGAPALAQSDVAFAPEVYAARRARLAERVGGAPVIVPGANLIRSGGEGRQDPNFWYLTGVESPYAIFVMVGAGEERRETLFLPERFQFAGAQYPFVDERLRNAPWNRPIRRLAPGPEAERATGIERTAPIDTFAERLATLVGDAPVVYFAGERGERYAPPGLEPPATERQQLERSVARLLGGRRVENATPLVEAMRLVKDEHEIAALRRAAAISVVGLVEAMRATRPGMNDRTIAGLMEAVWKREGAHRAAFGPIVSSGPAAVSLYTLKAENYNATDRVMRDGELLFVDYGAAEYRMYASDLCRTWPVSGRFTPEQKRYYEIVLEAQEAAIARIAPGVDALDVVRAAAEVFRRHGLERYEDIDRMGVDHVWGVMPSPTHYLVRGAGLTDYSGAGGTGVRDLGHHIGLEAIDARVTGRLEPGMVFTVEPKLYIPDAGIAIMIEDMILVTEEGSENLSAAAPRTVEAIERVMAEGRGAAR